MTASLADWKGVPAPTTTLIEGRFIRLERLDPARHADELFNALKAPAPTRNCGTICLTAHSLSAACSMPG